MKMSPAYLAETAEFLRDAGFEYDVEEARLSKDGEVEVRSTRHRLRRGEHESLVLECVEHAEYSIRYFLEISNFHGLACHSSELDSWKHRPGSVELKLRSQPERADGFAFRLRVEAG